MSGFLFHDVIFGPVLSRRLGLSLGINLLPSHAKYCSFNCIYCECGWTPENVNLTPKLPSRKLISQYLEYRLKELIEEDHIPDALTYAGNGEPTMHPDFAGIVEDTLALRDKYMPGVKVAILSNASMIHESSVFNALLKVDHNIQKLDAGFDWLFRRINNPVLPVKFNDIVRDLKKFKGKVIIFWDDNIAGDMEYAKSLFRAITPYRKWWSSQATLQVGQDDEFLELAAQSGCKQLFLGLESISQQSMIEVNKTFNRVEEYSRVIRRIHSYGIAVQAGIVFGFDHDTPDIFKVTLDFLEEAGVQNATFNILTPLPGTPLFRRMDNDGRILTRDWREYNGRESVVYKPRQMSVAELQAGFRYANERFYSLPSIAKRLCRSPVQFWWALPLNVAYGYQWRKTAQPAVHAQSGETHLTE